MMVLGLVGVAVGTMATHGFLGRSALVGSCRQSLSRAAVEGAVEHAPSRTLSPPAATSRPETAGSPSASSPLGGSPPSSAGGSRAQLLPWGNAQADAAAQAAARTPPSMAFRAELGRAAAPASDWRLRTDTSERPEIGRTRAVLEPAAGDSEDGDHGATGVVLRGELAALPAESGGLVGFALATQPLPRGLPAGTRMVRFSVRTRTPDVVFALLLESHVDDTGAAAGESTSVAAGNRRKQMLSHHGDFIVSRGGEWCEVMVPLAALRPNRRGRTLPDAPPPRTAAVRGVGLAILRSRQNTMAREGAATPFEIEVADGAFMFLA